MDTEEPDCSSRHLDPEPGPIPESAPICVTPSIPISISTTSFHQIVNSPVSHRRISQFQEPPITPSSPSASATTAAAVAVAAAALQQQHNMQFGKKHQQVHEPLAQTQQEPSPTDLFLPLHDHLYKRGFLQGLSSDVTIKCFGQEYKLHKLILNRSPYFAALVDDAWASNELTLGEGGSGGRIMKAEQKVHEITFGEDDNITKEALEIVLARLYGHEDPALEKEHMNQLLAVATYLDLPDMIEACADNIIKAIGKDTIVTQVRTCLKYDYGAAGRRIQNACRTYLLMDGYELPLSTWMELPSNVCARVIGEDGFFVPSEWDRVQFLVFLYFRKVKMCLETSVRAQGQQGRHQHHRHGNGHCKHRGCKRVYVHRLTRSQAAELAPLRDTLNCKIHYCHLTFDQLKVLEQLKDHRGSPLIAPEALKNALWLQTGLRHKITNIPKYQEELGFLEPYTGRHRPKRESAYDAGGVSNRHNSNSIANGNGSTWYCDQSAPGSSSSSVDTPKPAVPCSESCCSASDSETDSDYSSSESYESSSSSDDDAASLRVFHVPTDDDSLDLSAPSYSALNTTGTPRPPKKVTKYPPFRFSVRFDDITSLRSGGDKRLYSRTYWYAGSYWNIYIQKVASRRGHQLGVYLHRSKVNSSSGTGSGSGTGGVGAGGGLNGGNLQLMQRLSLLDLTDNEPLLPMAGGASTAAATAAANATGPGSAGRRSLFFNLPRDTTGTNTTTNSEGTGTGDGQTGFDWDLVRDQTSSTLLTANSVWITDTPAANDEPTTSTTTIINNSATGTSTGTTTGTGTPGATMFGPIGSQHPPATPAPSSATSPPAWMPHMHAHVHANGHLHPQLALSGPMFERRVDPRHQHLHQRGSSSFSSTTTSNSDSDQESSDDHNGGANGSDGRGGRGGVTTAGPDDEQAEPDLFEELEALFAGTPTPLIVGSNPVSSKPVTPRPAGGGPSTTTTSTSTSSSVFHQLQQYHQHGIPLPPVSGLGLASLAGSATGISSVGLGSSSNTTSSTGAGTGVTGSGAGGTLPSTTGSTIQLGPNSPNPLPDYLDERHRIQAYFEIYTPARRAGQPLTCFSSSPDMFNFAQSWGWKSATLCATADEMLRRAKHLSEMQASGRSDTRSGKRDEEAAARGLKFMVVIGLV